MKRFRDADSAVMRRKLIRPSQMKYPSSLIGEDCCFAMYISLVIVLSYGRCMTNLDVIESLRSGQA